VPRSLRRRCCCWSRSLRHAPPSRSTATRCVPRPRPLRTLPAAPRIVTPIASTQWIRIDPATGVILPDATPTTQRAPLLQTPAAPMRLRESSKGHLYIETRGYRSVMTMSLDEDGAQHAACGDPRHAHAAGDAQARDAGGAR
jgi:hypothetical protein